MTSCSLDMDALPHLFGDIIFDVLRVVIRLLYHLNFHLIYTVSAVKELARLYIAPWASIYVYGYQPSCTAVNLCSAAGVVD